MILSELFNEDSPQTKFLTQPEGTAHIKQAILTACKGAQGQLGLMSRHSDFERWPETLKRVIKTLSHKLPSHIKSFVPDIAFETYQEPVIYLPYILAYQAGTNTKMLYTDNPPAIFKAKLLKEFDTKWFNEVYHYMLPYIWLRRNSLNSPINDYQGVGS